jgi:hypothetical protein
MGASEKLVFGVRGFFKVVLKTEAEDVIRQIGFQRRRKRNANLKQESSDANEIYNRNVSRARP